MTDPRKFQTPAQFIEDGLFCIRTGDWRYQRPVTNKDKCTKCIMCWMHCPAQCIVERDTHYEADLEYCKGCGICSNICEAKAIEMEVEVPE